MTALANGTNTSQYFYIATLEVCQKVSIVNLLDWLAMPKSYALLLRFGGKKSYERLELNKISFYSTGGCHMSKKLDVLLDNSHLLLFNVIPA